MPRCRVTTARGTSHATFGGLRPSFLGRHGRKKVLGGAEGPNPDTGGALARFRVPSGVFFTQTAPSAERQGSLASEAETFFVWWLSRAVALGSRVDESFGWCVEKVL